MFRASTSQRHVARHSRGDAEEAEGDGEGEAGAEGRSVLVEGLGARVGLED